MRLAELAARAGAERFVFASSCSMYGASGSATPVDESAPLAPLTAYAESKVRAERSLAALASDDFSPVSLRFATAYGASPRLRLDIVLNNLVGWAITTGAVRLQSDGSAWRPLIHVEDMARACLAAVEAPRELIHGEAFNTGDTRANYLVRDLALIVKDVVPGSEVTFAEGAGADPRSYQVDFSKIASTLEGFRCEWDARRGAEQLAAAYNAAGLDEAEFRGDRFTRLLRLKKLLAEHTVDDELRRLEPAGARAGSMIFTESDLAGAFIIDLERREDDRGFFARAFCQNEFAEHGLKPVIAQANVAYNRVAGHPARDALPVSAGGRDQARALHARRDPRHHRRPAAREPDLPAAHLGRARRGQPPRALRARAVRARLPDAGRRHRDELPGRRVLHARRRGRPRATTIRGSGSAGRCRSRSSRTRTRSWEPLRRRSSPSCARDEWRSTRDHRRHRTARPARPRAGRSASASSAPASWARASPTRSSTASRACASSAISNRQARPRGRGLPLRRPRRRVAGRHAGRSSRTRSRAGRPAVTEDAFLLCRSEHIDVSVEVTGAVEFGAHVVARGVQARQGRRADERRDRRDDRPDPAESTPTSTA